MILCIISFTCLFTACEKDDGKTRVQFATWGSQSEIAVLEPIIADFEKNNPEIKIELMHIPQNYFQKLHLLFASNLAPDVVFINNLYIPLYKNHLEDLSLFVNKEEFFPQSIEVMSYEKKLYAVPRDISNLVIYYNKDLFKKFEIAYPERDWTFDDFIKISEKFKKNDVFSISFEKAPIFYLPYLMSEGGGILSDNLSKVIIDEPESKKGLKFYSDLRNKYNFAPKDSESASATMAQIFIQQRIAMHLSGRWLVPKYREVLNFDWDVINFPKGTAGSIVPLDGSGWAMAKSSKHKKEAWKFIQFLAGKENIEKFTKSGLITPARKDVANSEVFLSSDKKPKSSKVFLDIIEKSKKTPVSIDYSELTDEIGKKLEYMF